MKKYDAFDFLWLNGFPKFSFNKNEWKILSTRLQ